MPPFSEKDIESYFNKACEFHSQSRFAAAEKIYLHLIEFLPDSSLLHYNLGLLYYETKRFKEALNHYSASRIFAPDDPDVLFNYALCQAKLKKFSDAITSFTTFTSTYPNDSDGFYNLGNCYRKLHDFEKALAAYRHALKIDPDHLPANKNLAYVYHLLGDTDNAVSLYSHIIKLEPENVQAMHMIASIQGKHMPQAPPEYVKAVFDTYSETFETNVLEDLQYTVPVQLRMHMDRLHHPVKSFAKGIDLGCGTGLAGIEFHERCEHLTGIDISAKMIEKAVTKNVYDVLERAEATFFLKTTSNTYELVIGSDILTYIGDLDPIFEALTSATTEHAFFCFSTESSLQPDFQLCTTGRFAHADKYVIETAGKYGWRCLDSVKTHLRKEKSDWVEGSLYFMEKS